MDDIDTSWIPKALNGSSYRSAIPWHPSPNDLLAGVVTEVGDALSKWGELNYLIVKAEAGSMGGEALQAGSWYRVNVGAAVLRRWFMRDNPVPGDRVALRYLGLRREGDYQAHEFELGTVKAERDWGEPPSWS